MENRTESPSEKLKDEAVTTSFKDIPIAPVRWLWEPVLAKGKITVIAGAGGLGKSQLTCNIAATITTGGKWPITGRNAPVGSVLMLAGEDDPQDTIAPRLEAAGAHMDKVHLLQGMRRAGKNTAVDLTSDLNLIATKIKEIGDVQVVIIDPLLAYAKGIDSHKFSDSAQFMESLKSLAEATGVAILCVMHLNKGASTDALTRLMGSVGFSTSARSVWLFARDGTDEQSQRRFFVPCKSNMAKTQIAFGCSIREVTLPNGMTAPFIEWETSPVRASANSLLATLETGPKRENQMNKACEIIKTELSKGEMPTEALREKCKESGVSDATFRSALESSKTEKIKRGFGKAGIWYRALTKEDNTAPSDPSTS